MEYLTSCYMCRVAYTISEFLTDCGILIRKDSPEECCICYQNKTVFVKLLVCSHYCCQKCFGDIYNNLNKEHRENRDRQMLEEQRRQLAIQELAEEEAIYFTREARINVLMTRRINNSFVHNEDPNIELRFSMILIAISEPLINDHYQYMFRQFSDVIPVTGLRFNETDPSRMSILDKFIFKWLYMECIWIKNLVGADNEWSLVNLNTGNLYCNGTARFMIPPPPYTDFDNTVVEYRDNDGWYATRNVVSNE